MKLDFKAVSKDPSKSSKGQSPTEDPNGYNVQKDEYRHRTLASILSLKKPPPKALTPKHHLIKEKHLTSAHSVRDNRPGTLKPPHNEGKNLPGNLSKLPIHRDSLQNPENFNFVQPQPDKSNLSELRIRPQFHKTFEPARFLGAIKNKLGVSPEEYQLSQSIASTRKDFSKSVKKAFKIGGRVQTTESGLRSRLSSLGDTGIEFPDELDQEVTLNLLEIMQHGNNGTHEHIASPLEENPMRSVIQDLKQLNLMALTANNKQEYASERSLLPLKTSKKTFQDAATFNIKRIAVPMNERVKFSTFLKNPWVDNYLATRDAVNLEGEDLRISSNTMKKVTAEESALRKSFIGDIEEIERKFLTEINGPGVYKNVLTKGKSQHNNSERKNPRAQIEGSFRDSSTQSNLLGSRTQSFATTPIPGEQTSPKGAQLSVISEKKERHSQIQAPQITHMIARAIDFSNQDKVMDTNIYKNLQTEPVAMNLEEHLKHIERVAESKRNKRRRIAELLLEFLRKIEKMGLTKEQV